jgi:hypothetical protein
MNEGLLQAERLLTVGLLDQADAIFRRELGRDPRSADALIGLARVALAREQDEEAYRLAAEAHRVDPDHDMARRMEARMAEVLATRARR